MRAKFQCAQTADIKYGSPDGVNQEVKLYAVHSTDKNDEDNQFSVATPSGTIEMLISNPAAIGFLQPGKKYYVDFTEAS